MTQQNAHITRRIIHVDTDTNWTDTEALKLEILKLRDELIGAIIREGELRARLDAMMNKDRLDIEHQAFKNHANILAINESLEEQIDDILNSRTWRIGRFFIKPVGKAKQVLRLRGKV
jgi:hypothetical protein